MKNFRFLRRLTVSILICTLSLPSDAQQCALQGGKPLAPVGQVTWTARTSLDSAAGFPEFTNPSSPAKYYRKKAISGTMAIGEWPAALGSCNAPQYPMTYSESGNYAGVEWTGQLYPLGPSPDNPTKIRYKALTTTTGAWVRMTAGSSQLGNGYTVDLSPGQHQVYMEINYVYWTVIAASIKTIGATLINQFSDHWDITQTFGESAINDSERLHKYSTSFPQYDGDPVTPPANLFVIDGYNYGMGTSFETQQTTRTMTGLNSCNLDSSAQVYRKYSGTVTVTLSEEDTVDAAFQRAKAALSGVSWGAGNTAFERTIPDANGKVGIAEAKYEAHFRVDCPGEYEVWLIGDVTNLATGQTRQNQHLKTTTQHLESGDQTVKGDFTAPERNMVYVLKAVELHSPGCSLLPVGGSHKWVDSVNVAFSLGMGPGSASAGSILLKSDAITPALYTPASLEALVGGDGATIVRAQDGALRQVKVPGALVDIRPLTAASYVIDFFSPADVGTQDPDTKIFALNSGSTPFSTATLEDPDAGQSSSYRLKITENRGGGDRVTMYSYDAGTGIWTLSEGNGLRQESVEQTVVGSDRTETRTIQKPDGPVSSVITRVYRTFAWGEELVSEVLDPQGAALTTAYEFYTDQVADGGGYGQLKLQKNADGSWERRTYDAQRRLEKRIRPYLNASSTAAESASRVTTTNYSTIADADGDGGTEELLTTVESTLGSETSRVYRVAWSKLVVLGGESFIRHSDVRCTVQGAAWNAATNLSSETLIYSTGSAKGRVRRVTNPDGTGTLSTYVVNAGGEMTTTVKTGALNATRDDIVLGTVSVGTTSAYGQVTTSSVSDIESGLVLNAWVASTFDSAGRPTRLDYTDGTYETRTYACCGLESSRDRSGSVTSYVYDDLGRQKDVVRNGITMRNTYDADGRVKSVTRIGTDASEMVQETNTYDLAGRLTERLDALDRATGYSDVFNATTGESTRTTTNPDASTRIEVRARDGSLLSVSGTAAAPLTYEYDSDVTGVYTKETRIGAAGATNEWTKSYTDFAGRGFKVVYADGASTLSEFNAVGQLVRQVDPDGIATLFAYNSRGEQEVTALDLANFGTIDYNGTDRIQKTVTTVAQKTADSVTYRIRRSTTQSWETNGADTPVTISVSEQSVDGLHSWQTTRGVGTSSATVLDGSGGRTVTTKGPDGVKTIQVYSAGLLASSTVKTAADVQLAAASYEYDAHGRLWHATDARNGTTTYTYFADDQIQTVVTPDPDALASGDGYDAQTTSYTYNSAGRVHTVTQPDGGVVTTTYWPTGAVKRVSGSRTYPSEYTYDPQGRTKTLTTWQDFAGATGAAVTTWNYTPERGFLQNKRYSNNTGPSYTYKPSGRLLTRTWVSGVVTTYGYNSAGDPTGSDYSDATPDVVITYDRAGRPKTRTDASGLNTLTYDVSGQLKDEDYSSGLLNTLGVHRTFDALGRLETVSVPSVYSAGYTYDAASRFDVISSGTNSATYAYVPNSALNASVTFKQGTTLRLTTAKIYDKLNRLESIANTPSTGGAQSVAYKYNNANQRTKATREDSAYWDYGYDALGQVNSAVKKLPSSLPIAGLEFAYTYDDIGNRKTATVNSQVSTYTPTLLNTYTDRTVPGVVDVLGTAASSATVTTILNSGTPQSTARQAGYFFKQLAIDNTTDPQRPMLKVTGVKNLVGAGGEDAVTEITKTPYLAETPETFVHDADGNLTDDARWHYTWDGENRLTTMETSAAAIAVGVARQKLEFAYDGQSRRFSKKVSDWNGTAYVLSSSTLYLYDGWNLVAELNALSSNAVLRTYVWGADLSGSLQGAGGVGGLLFANLGSATYAPIYDGNGNVLGLVDNATGARSATYEYNAFGETVIADGSAAGANRFRFSTKFTDEESGLLYYGLRYYSSGTGRWINRDPMGESGGLNLSGFLLNNATNDFDVLGEAGFWQTARGTVDNIVFFSDWLFNKGENHRRYTDGDNLTELLKESHGINEALQKYKAQGCPASLTGSYKTLQGYQDTFFDGGLLNPAEFQIGGFDWSIAKGSNNTEITFTITNNASWKSFLGEREARRGYSKGKQAAEGLTNPVIDRFNDYSRWDIPRLNLPIWDPWPIHQRSDVPMGGNIRQDFVFTMPNPCCKK